MTGGTVMSDQSKNILGLVYGVSTRARRVIETGLRERGLTFAQLGALKALIEKNGMSQAELAAALDTDSTTAMVLRTSLEKKNLVKRSSDPGDGRIKRIEITELGRSKVKASEPGIEAFYKKCDSVAAEADIKKATLVLQKYFDYIGETLKGMAEEKAGAGAKRHVGRPAKAEGKTAAKKAVRAKKPAAPKAKAAKAARKARKN